VNSFIHFNGDIFPSGTPLLTADSRGFRYGDGLFETMKVKEGRILLLDQHYQRLLNGSLLLGLEPLTSEQFTGAVLDLCQRNGHSASARVRLTVFRGEMGQDDAVQNYIIQSWPLEKAAEKPGGLVLGTFPKGRKACDGLSHLKSNNYLLYSMAAMYARNHGWDDCLVLNSRERLADATIANLFYIRDSVFYTPPLSEGVVDGVMRRHLLEALPGAGYAVVEQPVTVPDLMDADEVFLTNAVRGIVWVGSFEGKQFSRRLSAVVDEQLVKTL